MCVCVCVCVVISDTNTRLIALDEDVTTIEGDAAEQDDRMTVLESNVDLWDDRIIALEVSDTDISERLSTLEETTLGSIFTKDLPIIFLFFWTIYFDNISIIIVLL